MSTTKVTRYTFVFVLLLTVSTQNRYAKTTAIGHLGYDDDERSKVAAAVNGGVAVASSTMSDEFPASALIDGDRKGAGWGSRGGWADDTPGQFRDAATDLQRRRHDGSVCRQVGSD